jgi:hypothetical protein
MDANFEEMRAIMDAYYDREGAIMDAYYDREGAIMDAYYEKMRAIIKETFQEAMEVCRAVTPTCLEEEKESAPEKTEAVAEPQEDPEGVTDEETIGAAEDRSRDLRLAARCRGRLKTRTKREKSNDLIGNRTSDLPAYSIVPQPTMPLRAPISSYGVTRQLLSR